MQKVEIKVNSLREEMEKVQEYHDNIKTLGILEQKHAWTVNLLSNIF